MDLKAIIEILSSENKQKEELFARALEVKRAAVGNGVYLRGLIEYSNVCRKNCLYCGIRLGMESVERYTLTREEVLAAAKFAYENNYGSIVLQGGENVSPVHTRTITQLVKEIKKLSNGELGITLSMGEQPDDIYKEWYGAGAHRYLLRIETSNPELYKTLHPADGLHDYEKRLKALGDLKNIGYQVGTGVMIGLPGQTVGDLAADLLFMKELDVDMCGMGPYVVSNGTPLAQIVSAQSVIPTEQERFDMTLKMISALRLLMPDINIAATTALQAIDPTGRLKAVMAGANVIMPNITPEYLRGNYRLYDNKPLSLDSEVIEKHICYGEWGDSPHYAKRSDKT